MGVFAVLSPESQATTTPADIHAIRATLEVAFHPGWRHALPLLAVLTLVVLRMPALPSMLAGVALGCGLALAEGVPADRVLAALHTGWASDTGHPAVDELLTRGGMKSMADTVFLVFAAMSFGGIMERTGMLAVLAARLLAVATSAAALVATTIFTSVGINILAADQYLSIVVPGRMYASTFRERGLPPQILSRALEDGGTITSALVPWNTCGAFMAATLGVTTVAYLPWAVFNWLNPLLALLVATRLRAAPATGTVIR
jgi:NhaC family Na+:H+ antiporter